MGIQNIEDAKRLKEHGRRLGRDGMSQRVERLVIDFVENGGGYKAAMILAGRLKAICSAARCDDYWLEQVDKGWTRELSELHGARRIDPDDDVDFDRIREMGGNLTRMQEELLHLKQAQAFGPNVSLRSSDASDR